MDGFHHAKEDSLDGEDGKRKSDDAKENAARRRSHVEDEKTRQHDGSKVESSNSLMTHRRAITKGVLGVVLGYLLGRGESEGVLLQQQTKITLFDDDLEGL